MTQPQRRGGGKDGPKRPFVRLVGRCSAARLAAIRAVRSEDTGSEVRSADTTAIYGAGTGALVGGGFPVESGAVLAASSRLPDRPPNSP